ncbi:hypothetical protein ElyMa_001524000 [Elysia marginata]|uniref:Uncharacterized protein n=1 Tax=Elysia marginata TaxID=1093978 RepID=A0AAV4J7W4_9GAST|nr:hypothetical protein ElyMa_001524000 [Elysia marginata]
MIGIACRPDAVFIYSEYPGALRDAALLRTDSTGTQLALLNSRLPRASRQCLKSVMRFPGSAMHMISLLQIEFNSLKIARLLLRATKVQELGEKP